MTTPSPNCLSEEDESTHKRRSNRAVKQWRKIEEGRIHKISNDDKELVYTALSAKNLEKLVAERPQSVTAKRLLESARCMESGFDALRQNDIVLAASSLAGALRKNRDGFFIRRWTNDLVDLTMASMKALYSDTTQENQTRAEALFVHAILLSRFYKPTQQALKQCQLAHILLPQDPYILLDEGIIHSCQRDADASLKAVEKAASLCGHDEPEISLYYLAMALTSASASNDKKVISLLEKYVQHAEPDALKLPKALYQLAAIYGQQGPSSIGKAKRYFALAEKSEERGLPFEQEVLNPGLTQFREATRTFLKNYIA